MYYGEWRVAGSVKAPFIYIVQRTSRSHREGGWPIVTLTPYATNYFHFGTVIMLGVATCNIVLSLEIGCWNACIHICVLYTKRFLMVCCFVWKKIELLFQTQDQNSYVTVSGDGISILSFKSWDGIRILLMKSAEIFF